MRICRCSIVRPSDPKVEGHDCGIIIMGKGKRSNSCMISQFWSTLNLYHFSDIQTRREVWNHLKGMYLESNFAKQYEPKMSTDDIGNACGHKKCPTTMSLSFISVHLSNLAISLKHLIVHDN